MSITSAKLPGTAATIAGGGNYDWSDVNNIKAIDGSFSTCSLSTKPSTSYILLGTNFGFSASDIPSGSTINGIKLTIRNKSGGDAVDSSLYCYLNGSATGSNYASGIYWPMSLTDKVYGGATDLWGWTPTQGNILNSTFGFGLKVYSDLGNETAQVDSYKVEIYYTAPASSSFIQQIMKTNYTSPFGGII